MDPRHDRVWLVSERDAQPCPPAHSRSFFDSRINRGPHILSRSALLASSEIFYHITDGDEWLALITKVEKMCVSSALVRVVY